MSEMEKGDFSIKIFKKMALVLGCFNEDRNTLKYTDIVELLKDEVDKNAVYRILQNLVVMGFLEKGNKNNLFYIGHEINRLACVSISRYDFRNVMRPYLEKLNKITGETVIVNIEQNLQGICIERLYGTQNISITANIGRVVPLLRGASGKILAAYLTDSEIEALYERERENLTSSLCEVKAALKDIREKGYSVSFAELDKDTAGASYPIFNKRKEVIAGVSVISPLYRFNGEHLEDVIREMCFYTNEINRKIEYYE